MTPVLSTQDLTVSRASKVLFKDLQFGLGKRDRIGLIGPNGAGKSTLLKTLSGIEKPDSGHVTKPSGTKVAFVDQAESFKSELTAHQIVEESLIGFHQWTPDQANIQASIALSICEFEDFTLTPEKLSGGWKKRLALACAIGSEPDVLILDEPTNHMDWDSLFWLESWLSSFKGALMTVSHDRTFLNKVTQKTMELNPLYERGYLLVEGSYESFLQRKQEYMEAQEKQESRLANTSRRELEWLRAGVKARTTKSKSRAEKAYELFDELDSVKKRNQAGKNKVRLGLGTTEITAKRVLKITDLDIGYDDLKLIEKLNFEAGAQMRLGILGSNGTGKSSLLKEIVKANESTHPHIQWLEGLTINYVEQDRESLPEESTLVDFLGDGSDHVLLGNQSVHVNSYAQRFLFRSHQMNLKIKQFSGGEKARLLMAKKLLKQSDILILDEPTNDLDIDTIEILENALLDFEGPTIIVSHDRSFLEQVCHQYMALDGKGNVTFYSDVEQWLRDQQESEPAQVEESKAQTPKTKVKMSYKEKKQLETMEETLMEKEAELEELKTQIALPEIQSNHIELAKAAQRIDDKEKEISDLYELWEQLEEKLKKLKG